MQETPTVSPLLSKVKRFVVDSVLEVLIPQRMLQSQLAFWARLVVSLRKPFVIGVTGSVGKSTTTAMIAAVLSHPAAKEHVRGVVRSAVGNMNDDVGVPATLLLFDYGFEIPYAYAGRLALMFRLPFRALRTIVGPYPKVMVLECATDGRGQFSRTVNIAPPHVAIVTTVGAAHLENLKSLAGVANEKGALVRAAPSSGLVILGLGHDYVWQLEQMARAPVVKVDGRGVELSRNIVQAVCRHLGIAKEVVDAAMAEFKSPEGRLNRLELACMTVIDDTYNANPLSMKLGLDTLAEVAGKGRRRIAVLGHMGELGDESPRYHEEIGRYARDRADVIVGVGALAKHYSPDLWFETSNACAEEIDKLACPGDCLLIKGSASAKMKTVVNHFQILSKS